MTSLTQRRSLILISVALVWIAFSPNLLTQNSPAAQPVLAGGGFRVAGKVVKALGGNALGGVRVTLLDAKNRQDSLSTITSQEGVFEFLQLPAGKYALSGQKRGFIASAYQQHEQFSTAVVTGAGFDTEHLILQLPPFAVLSGKVLDESGEPIRHATVSLYREDHQLGVGRIEKVRQENTDDQGTFEFSGLRAGTFFLSATATPWYAVHRPLSSGADQQSVQDTQGALDVAYPVTYYKDATDSDEALPIPIRGGDRLEAHIHIGPVPAIRLLFHVPGNGENGFAPPMLQRPAFDGLEAVPFQSVEMVSKGLYATTGIAPGAYTVRMRDAGQGNPVDVNVNLTQDGQELDTAKGEPVSTVKVTVHAAGEETLPAQLSVGLRNSKLRVVGWQPVSPQGNVEFNDIAAGKYEVLVFSPQRAYSLLSISSEAGEISGHILNVPAGSSVDISLSVVGSTMNVEGVAKKDGKPFAGAMVVLVPKDAESNRTLFRRDQSDMDGTFSLPNVLPGTYTIVAIEDGWDLDWGSPGVIAAYARKGNPVTIRGNQGTMRVPDAVEIQLK